MDKRWLIILTCLSLCIPKTFSALEECAHPGSAKGFGTTYFTALAIGNNPHIIYRTILPAQQASDLLYNVNIRILQETGLTIAEDVSSTVARAVTLWTPFSLDDYLFYTGLAIGTFLWNNKVVTCDNAIDLGLSFAAFTQQTLKKLDETKLESYFEAVLRGIIYFIDDRGFNLAFNQWRWEELANDFYNEYVGLSARRAAGLELTSHAISETTAAAIKRDN